MIYKFGVAQELAPLPGIKQFWGVAFRNTESNRSQFYLTVSPLSITLSVDPTDEGKKLIIYFTRVLGEPELIYRDKKTQDYIDDYTAKWYTIENSEVTTQRLQHLMHGLEPEDL
ncbi:MAG: hypothetical protein LBH74_04925 [Nitrososphaerota archaeon]|jgi:hypothetical protein|nr:hypothetical protein [Nitrososphaerota archaeon]